MESEINNQSCCRGCMGVCSTARNTSSNSTIPSNSYSNSSSNTSKVIERLPSECHHFMQGDNSIRYPDKLLTILDRNTMDSYTAGIELSNACREFYVKRQKDAESLKSKLSTKQSESGGDDSSSLQKSQKVEGQPGTTLQPKLDLLKEQLSSLIDQDLLLMKQFLTLNERIEELKWQRKMESYQMVNTADSTLSNASSSLRRSVLRTNKSLASSSTSSRVMSTEFLDLKYPTPSELSLFNECSTETLSPSNGDMSLKRGKALGSLDADFDAKDDRAFDSLKFPSSSYKTSTLDKFMFKTTASVRSSDCSNHKDVVGHCVHCPRNLMNLGQVTKETRSSGAMYRADSGHITEGSKCSTLSSNYTDTGERQRENTSFDSGISDYENHTDFYVDV